MTRFDEPGELVTELAKGIGRTVITEVLSDEDASEQESREPGNIGPGSIIDGRYRLEQEIGRGGMGAVYRGSHLALGVPIAVKVMLDQVAGNSEYARRFRREARAMSQLRHRNIASVMDYGDVGGTPYMVIEYLEGMSLAQRVASRGLPSLAELTTLFCELVDGLEAAHRNGIIHRDLKPDNIFLAEESDGRHVVKVLDFGLAKVLQSDESPENNITEVGLVAGTPHYMSPEQCRSMDVGPSADIYSLGCVLTTLLQGRPPFSGDSNADLMSYHLMLPPPELERAESEEVIPLSLEALRLDMLAKTPEARPRSMERVRTRFLDTMGSRQAPESRRSSAPTGSRQERAPDWEAEASLSSPRLSRRSMPTGSPDALCVSVVKLSKESTVDEGWMLGLQLHGMEVRREGLDDTPPGELSLVVLDCVDAPSAALKWLEQHPKWAPYSIVCGTQLTPHLPALIAANVGDLFGYPVDAPSLARKLMRLSRDLK